MLVLSRRRDETIMIGDEVEITVVDIRGDTVRLGINAPRNVSVHRKEIYDAIQAEMLVAAQETVPDQNTVGNLLGSMLKKQEEDRAKLESGPLKKLTGGVIPSSLSAPPPTTGRSTTRKIAKKTSGRQTPKSEE